MFAKCSKPRKKKLNHSSLHWIKNGGQTVLVLPYFMLIGQGLSRNRLAVRLTIETHKNPNG